MNYDAPLVEAVFLRRYKRFFVDVALDGQVVTAHCANTGSMRSCTAPEAPVRLSYSDNPKRKLAWSVEQIRVDGRWIVVNTARPNHVVAEGIAAGRVPELAGYPRLERERPLGNSRVDLRLSGAQGCAWVEVKNVTLVEDDIAWFPDAVTARGTKHLRELADAVAPGVRAVLFLHVGHEGGREVRPAVDVDPVWAGALVEAVHRGVEVVARRCRMSATGLELGEAVPVTIPGR